jgi:hypothetical protein
VTVMFGKTTLSSSGTSSIALKASSSFGSEYTLNSSFN